MPITFRCPKCTQALRMADHLAGRRCRCPSCGAILNIPALDEPEEPAEEAPPRPARPSQRSIAKEQAPPSRRRTAPARDEDDYDDRDDTPEEEQDRPRRSIKKKKRRKTPMLLFGLIGGGVALLLMCSGVGGLAWWYFSGGVADELKYMPNNCQVLVSARTAQMMESDVYKQLKGQIPDIDKQNGDATKELGLAVEDIEQIVIGVGANSKDVVIVARTKKAVDAGDLRARIQNASYTETKVGKYLLQESATDGRPSFCVVGKKHVVLGEKEALRTVLLRDRKPDFSANMQAAMKQVDFSKSLVVAADVQASRAHAKSAFGMFGQGQEILGSLDKITAVAVQAQLASDVRFEMTLFCQDAGAANDVKKLIDGFSVMARNSKMVSKEVGDMLELNLKVDGNKVSGGNTFKIDPLIKLIKQTKGQIR